MQELLGDRLITAPVQENEITLPSPNQLRYRIILKNKKIPTGGNLINHLNRPLMRTSTIDDPIGSGAGASGHGNAGDIEEDYDSDYGEDDFDDDIQGTKKHLR